jgi:uncharacterized protein YrzB (UPF0473 family)
MSEKEVKTPCADCGHDHDHDHNHEEMDMEVVTLVDDEGVEHEFELVEILEIDEMEYAVLFP